MPITFHLIRTIALCLAIHWGAFAIAAETSQIGGQDKPAETFGGSWPYQPKYINVGGVRLHYVDEGNGPETLLLLHGEPTWSFLFRQQIAEWSKRYRVIALDHMGFGRSGAPTDRTYYLQDHVDNLEKFVAGLALKDITLVMHDFGGPVGMGFALRHPDKVDRIVSVNGPTPMGQADLPSRLAANAEKSPWFQWIFRAADNNTLVPTLNNAQYNILSTLKLNGFVRNEVITPQWIRAYASPYLYEQRAMGAIGWAEGIANGKHHFAAADQKTAVKLSNIPALALWGEEDHTLHADEFLPLFHQAFPNGTSILLPGAGHYSPEDAPQAINAAVIAFVEQSR